MLKEGEEKIAKYWGKFKVKKVARLVNPVKCYSNEIGDAFFNPTLVKIEWEHSPSEDKNEFWFPYWISIGGKEKYGQKLGKLREEDNMSYLRLLHFVRNDREWLYISLHKFYNKNRNLLKTVALRIKGNLTPSSPPVETPLRFCNKIKGFIIYN